MARYDRGYGGPRGGWRGQGGGMRGRGFPPGPGGQPFGGGYGGRGWQTGEVGPGHPAFEAFRSGAFGPGGFLGGFPGGAGGGGRGEYGGAYEGYGGYSGGRGPGDGGAGARRGPGRGYDRGWGGGGGYAREPFMPEEAYRRHPEYRQDRQPREWEAHQHEYGDDELGDDEVRDAVYRRMSADAWVDAARIEVQVEDGIVTLTGEVDDFMEARYAWDDAWEAEGVRGVVNNLTVRADQPHESHGDVVVQAAGDRTSVEDEGAG
jgi:BON domain